MPAVVQMFTLLLLTVISLTNSQPPYGQNRYQPPPQYIPPRPRIPPRRQPPTHRAPQPPQQPPVHQPPVHQPPVHQQPAYQQPAYQQPTYQPPTYQPPAYQPPAPQTPTAHAPVLQSPVGHPPLQPGTMGPGARKKPSIRQCMNTWCAFRRREYSPRCGYDGESYQNECMVQCRQTYEACSGTCPCYEGISSPPDHVFVVPNPRVFPRSMRTNNGGKKGKARRRPKRGRRPNCFCYGESIEEHCSTLGKTLPNLCEAYCTYAEIMCDRRCPCRPTFQFGGPRTGAGPTGEFAG